MEIRIGTAKELEGLWNNDRPTTNYFIEKITTNEIEFWLVFNEETETIIGELYIIWDSFDKDEANGINRAYLCAYRIRKQYRGLGLGLKLMNRVLARIKQNGFTEVTIGVEATNNKLIQLYKNYGFNQFIKYQQIDLHDIDQDGNPTKVDPPTALYLKSI